VATSLYGKARESFLKAEINLATDTIKAILIDAADYTVSIDVDQFLSDIPAAAREEISAALAGKTTTLGVFDANDVTFSATSGDPCEAIVLYQDTGVAGTSRLIAYIDNAAGLAVTLGGDVTVVFDNGANKIFKL
jgi:hypothetical protein